VSIAEPGTLANGTSKPVGSVPQLSLDALRVQVMAAPQSGGRIAALFCTKGTRGCTNGCIPGDEGGVDLWAVIAHDSDGVLSVLRTGAPVASFASMTHDCPEVHLFEREIAEQSRVVPEGHPWLKPVRFPPGAGTAVGTMDFYRIEGESIHEVAVGPVHAGVIEPGHFRFQCYGEQVFHLEIALGYQHRGVERALVGGPDRRSLHYMETVAGDTTVGHATAYCQVVEALAGCQPSARADAVRGIALELERMANHAGNLGALAGDVGFLPAASAFGRLRGDFLNVTADLCGNRFGRGLVCPGGVGFDIEPPLAAKMVSRLEAALRDVESVAEMLFNTPSVQARFEETGRVDGAVARGLGLVGLGARASGLVRDVRQDFPTGIYRFSQIPVATWASGDVFARAYVRYREVQRSYAFVRDLVSRLPRGTLRRPVGPLPPDGLAVALVEGFRGEICHVGITGPEGKLARYKVVDPSFHNWMGLSMALRDQAISDFPLCNKSFDLSYCGFDL
jgi:Ni,Fe-hydrogenase III large subunit